MSEIAFAYGDDDRVALWCTRVRREEDGRVFFEVINGLWTGSFDPAGGTLKVHATGREFPARIVWEGDAPFNHADYNEAIEWIGTQRSDKAA